MFDSASGIPLVMATDGWENPPRPPALERAEAQPQYSVFQVNLDTKPPPLTPPTGPAPAAVAPSQIKSKGFRMGFIGKSETRGSPFLRPEQYFRKKSRARRRFLKIRSMISLFLKTSAR